MDRQQHFRMLMDRTRAGSEEAARELVETFGDDVREVVRRKLDNRLRRKFDSSDFLQSAWTAFFARRPQEQRSFDRPEDLVAFLVAVVRNKIVEATRRHLQSLKYNASNEHSLDGSAAMEAQQLSDPAPTPCQVAMAQEKWDRLQALTHPRWQGILQMLRKGATHQEIATQLGVSEKKVQRFVQRLVKEADA